jgi:hypothetical protein
MNDDPKTIEHDPFETHRTRPATDRCPREPIFGPGFYPLVLTVIVGLVIARYVAVPFGDWVGDQACNHLSICSNDQLAAKKFTTGQ